MRDGRPNAASWSINMKIIMSISISFACCICFVILGVIEPQMYTWARAPWTKKALPL